MSVRYGDRDVTDDTAVLVDRLDDLDARLFNLIEVMERIAVVAEAWAKPAMWVKSLHCNCPESGTSGSCPFHDATTVQP